MTSKRNPEEARVRAGDNIERSPALATETRTNNSRRDLMRVAYRISCFFRRTVFHAALDEPPFEMTFGGRSLFADQGGGIQQTEQRGLGALDGRLLFGFERDLYSIVISREGWIGANLNIRVL